MQIYSELNTNIVPCTLISQDFFFFLTDNYRSVIIEICHFLKQNDWLYFLRQNSFEKKCHLSIQGCLCDQFCYLPVIILCDMSRLSLLVEGKIWDQWMITGGDFMGIDE